MDNTFFSAIIAGIVSLIGVIVAYATAKQQFRMKIKEISIQQQKLEIERKKLESINKELKNEMSIINQHQLQEILKKRIEIYPYLWQIITKYWQHTDNNEKDIQWCKLFVQELKLCNEKYGVYFSQSVYKQYHELIQILNTIYLDLNIKDYILDNEQINTINTIWYGSIHYGPGLAYQIKNDLGSYKIALIQDRQV